MAAFFTSSQIYQRTLMVAACDYTAIILTIFL